MKDIKPDPIHIIKDPKAVKSIADPQRNQIMEVLMAAPLTVNQIAEKLGLAPSRLYYHVNMLEKHGLIRVVDTSVHGNIIEKHYWLTAYDYEIDKDLLNFNITTEEGKDNIIRMLLANVETTREDLIRSMEARAFNLEQGAEPHPRRVIDFRDVCLIPEERMEDFQERLHDLLKEFSAAHAPDSADTHPWALSVLLYPSFYYQQKDGQS
ncbi:MAG: winged helix-turn-helix domain-containing protein [Anaerolineales bacterium]|jgi:DNA-binding transcriptional ArsR family regulator